MSKKLNVTVLGCGGWGTALSILLCNNGHSVTMWSPFETEVEALRATHSNERLLPGVIINDQISFTSDISVTRRSDMVVMVTPSVVVDSTAKLLVGNVRPNCVIVDASKGFHQHSLERLSEVILSVLPDNPVVALSGPSHAEEVARGIVTSLVAASANLDAAIFVQEAFSSDVMRIYVNSDVVGVEVGGALKNIIALACGIGDGLGIGDNTRAALMTRGLTEIARLGCAMGADKDTFAGLSGLGDLIVTCTSMHSRNRRFGIEIGRGSSVEQALQSVGMTVEGYHAVRTAHLLSEKYAVDMPITNECYAVLYCNQPVGRIVQRLMRRPTKHELDSNWLK